MLAFGEPAQVASPEADVETPSASEEVTILWLPAAQVVAPAKISCPSQPPAMHSCGS